MEVYRSVWGNVYVFFASSHSSSSSTECTKEIVFFLLLSFYSFRKSTRKWMWNCAKVEKILTFQCCCRVIGRSQLVCGKCKWEAEWSGKMLQFSFRKKASFELHSRWKCGNEVVIIPNALEHCHSSLFQCSPAPHCVLWVRSKFWLFRARVIHSTLTGSVCAIERESSDLKA